MSLPLQARERAPARAWAPALAIALGCAALMLRTPSAFALGPLIAVGVLGLTAPAARADRASSARIATVTAVGMGAFAIVRLTTHPLAAAVTTYGLAANVVAGIAEEAFFRRFVYGRLEARGDTVAIVASAVLFALVHIPMYGVAVLPIDFAAGLLFGWQRRESGTWTPSAATHIVANLLQMR